MNLRNIPGSLGGRGQHQEGNDQPEAKLVTSSVVNMKQGECRGPGEKYSNLHNRGLKYYLRWKSRDPWVPLSWMRVCCREILRVKT